MFGDTMRKFFNVFMAFLAVAVVAYISLALWSQQSTFKTLSNAQHSMVNDSVRQLTMVHDVGKDRHRQLDPKKPENHRRGDDLRKDTRQQLHRKKLKSISNADNNERNQLSLNQTMAPDSVVLRGNVSSQIMSQKYLIYFCHKKSCGGWADRQRGLVSVYILSLVTDRKFGIIMDNPCNVTHFYVPNDVNWIIPAAELKDKTSIVINDIGSKADIRTLLEKGFNEVYHQDVVYIRTNNAKYHLAISKVHRYAEKLPRWTRAKQRISVFAKGWKTLMRPSQYLQHRLDDYLRSIGYEQRTSYLVCSHVRIGKSDSLKADGRTRMNVSDITGLWKFLDPYVQNGSKVFLATDNLEVRNLTRQRFGGNMTDTGGVIVHVDRSNGVSEACSGFGYAVLDQLILTKCDVLVLTESGFGARAASIRGDSNNLFQLVRDKVKKIGLR